MEIDYRSLPVEVYDVYLLTTDGVHDYLDDTELAEFTYASGRELDKTASAILASALEQGSHDNVTCIVLKVEELPHQNEHEFYQQFSELPFPPLDRQNMLGTRNYTAPEYLQGYTGGNVSDSY